MKVFVLGGAGRIIREAALDLVINGNFEKITIADYNEQGAKEVAEWLNNPNVDYCFCDVNDKEATVKKMNDYDIVMDGTTISLNDKTTECIALAGCHGINLNGFGEEYKYSDIFKEKGKVMIPGFGMTPGTTNMMALHAADKMDKIHSIRVSHGAYRPFAFSTSIAETTSYEYDPQLPGRIVYENGEFIQVPPFARPREIALPEPYGVGTQYIIPHSETFTLAQYFKARNKEVGLIEVRGTWPQQNMRLVKALYEYGFLQNQEIELNGNKFGIMDAIAKYLCNSEQGKTTELYGYALHVEVVGEKDGQTIEHTVYHTHPTSDGSIREWAGLRAYTRNVGIPVGCAVRLIAEDKFQGCGALIPEEVFQPEDIFNELKKHDILMHEKIHVLV